MEKEREISLYTGKKVTLTMEEMQVISTIYRSIIEAEYIAENYFVSDEQANRIAEEVVESMSEFITGETENEIIQSVLRENGYCSVPVDERMDNCYGDYPTLDEIKRDYKELMSMVKEVTTIEQLKGMKNNKFGIKVNGIALGDFLNYHINDITSIRYREYGCLVDICVYIKDEKVDHVTFDVWSNKEVDVFICGTSIDKVEDDYEKYFNPVPPERTEDKKILTEQEAYELLDLLNKVGIEATKNESSISLADGKVNIPVLNGKNLFVPGDIVIVTKPGKCYSRYYEFFGRYGISQDITCRYDKGTSLITVKPALYKILAVHSHEDDEDIKIAVIERIEDKKVYLIETAGIEKAVVEVENPGYCYSTYKRFFTYHHISDDIVKRYVYGRELNSLCLITPHTKFRVLGVYPHEKTNEDVAIIESMDDETVYLIGAPGLKIV